MTHRDDRYNTFRIGMGISVGSESSGGVKDIYIHDNVVGVCEAGSCLDTCCGWGPGIHIKTTLTRGQFLSNIIVENNTIYNNTVRNTLAPPPFFLVGCGMRWFSSTV